MGESSPKASNCGGTLELPDQGRLSSEVQVFAMCQISSQGFSIRHRQSKGQKICEWSTRDNGEEFDRVSSDSK